MKLGVRIRDIVFRFGRSNLTRFSVISADSHVVEPPNTWVDHIDPEFRSRAPHVVKEGEYDVFECEEVELIQVGGLTGAGRPSSQIRNLGSYQKDAPPGAYDPHPRLGEIAPDGIEAEVLYPSIALRMFAIRDVDYQFACFHAYNRWIAEFIRPHPDRFKGIGIIPTSDVERSVQEVSRAKELGLSGVAVSVAPDDDSRYDDPALDPLWQAAQTNELPVSLHILTPRRLPRGETAIDRQVRQTLYHCAIQDSLSRLILSGVLHRFPEIKIVSAENDIGWAGHFLERIDYLFERRQASSDLPFPENTRPSDFFHRNVFLTFIRDRSAVLVRGIVGVDNMMWSSDYPHPDSTYPNSRAMMDYLFDGVAEDDRSKMVAGNVASLYGFD